MARLRWAMLAGVFLLVPSWGCSDDSSGGKCGDGVVQQELGEECDGNSLRGYQCSDFGFRQGTLRCVPPGQDNECTFDTSGCYNHLCGNGVKEEGEDCDGYDMGGASCQSLGHDGGFLRCNGPDTDAPCTFDESQCLDSPYCGDGVADVDQGEECDGADLNGQSCETLNYIGGTLLCAQDCTFDTRGCVAPVCGNGVKEADEVCDGTDLGGETCMTQGFIQGDLHCSNDCTAFDTSDCTGIPECGNNIKEGPEVCDGSDLGGESCLTLGYLEGELTCDATCSGFDTSGCSGQNNCQVDQVLGTLNSGDPPVTVSDDFQNLDNSTTVTDCNRMDQLLAGPDAVYMFTLPTDGTLTVEYSMGSGMTMSAAFYGLYSAGGADCNTNEITCDQVMDATGTITLTDLTAGTYYFIWESGLPIRGSTPYSLEFRFQGQEICDNNVDDDNNGLTDCEDSIACCQDPACSSSPACNGFDGQACTSDASCLGGTCLTEAGSGLPGGFCTRTCSGTSDCASGFDCLTYKNQNVCLKLCSGSSSECRAGYLCADMGGGSGLCYPNCEQASDCPDTNQCNIYSGFCETTDATKQDDGGPCTDGSECKSGICLTEANTNAPGGYCVSLCNGQTGFCPDDGVCVNYLGTTMDGWYCFDACADVSECRNGYQCTSNPFNPPPTDTICTW